MRILIEHVKEEEMQSMEERLNGLCWRVQSPEEKPWAPGQPGFDLEKQEQTTARMEGWYPNEGTEQNEQRGYLAAPNNPRFEGFDSLGQPIEVSEAEERFEEEEKPVNHFTAAGLVEHGLSQTEVTKRNQSQPQGDTGEMLASPCPKTLPGARGVVRILRRRVRYEKGVPLPHIP